MRQAGDVTYADAHKNKRNEGCVEFGSYSVSFDTIIYDTHQAVSQVWIFGLSLACHYVRVAVWAQYDQKLRSAKS